MAEDRKVALITGITGQDGSYLAELLLEKGYCVSFPNFCRPRRNDETIITHANISETVTLALKWYRIIEFMI